MVLLRFSKQFSEKFIRYICEDLNDKMCAGFCDFYVCVWGFFSYNFCEVCEICVLHLSVFTHVILKTVFNH